MKWANQKRLAEPRDGLEQCDVGHLSLEIAEAGNAVRCMRSELMKSFNG